MTDADRNHAQAMWSERVRAAVAGAPHGVDLVVLPELHQSPYFCQTMDTRFMAWAEPVPGPTTDWASRLAKQHGVVMVVSVFEHRASGLYHNTAVVIEKDGTLAGRYRKMHIPDDPGYHEKYYFTPGDQGFDPIATSVGSLGVLVCWDQWFPEAARLMALRGAQCLIYPTAIGWDPAESHDTQQAQHRAWHTVQTAHAVVNGLPVLVCNRAGWEPCPGAPARGIQFWGSSFAVDAQGQQLGCAGVEADEVVYVQWDPEATQAIRNVWPFFRDRRLDAYAGLMSRWGD